jgi:hypothetical protein
MAALLAALAAPGLNPALAPVLFIGCWWGHVHRASLSGPT